MLRWAKGTSRTPSPQSSSSTRGCLLLAGSWASAASAGPAPSTDGTTVARLRPWPASGPEQGVGGGGGAAGDGRHSACGTSSGCASCPSLSPGPAPVPPTLSWTCSIRKHVWVSPSALEKPRVWPWASARDSPLPTSCPSTQTRFELTFFAISRSALATSSRCVQATLKRRAGSGNHAPNMWGWWCRPTCVVPLDTLKLSTSMGRAARSSGATPAAYTHVRRHLPAGPRTAVKASALPTLCCCSVASSAGRAAALECRLGSSRNCVSSPIPKRA
mmetsp:Transcript_12484/g.38700  ORF Transcript_12484/g.38700 Transcript_12484/m.38700 type:complete len:274 (+) Transcript_12484:162-983(+)